MRVLLAGVLLCVPFTAQGQALDALPNEGASSSFAQPTAPPTIEQSVAPEPTAAEHMREPFPNPYGPASATNFDPFAVPLVPRTEMSNRSSQNGPPNNSGPIGAFYGHIGHPLFPDSIAIRGETSHPFPMDSSINLFGRNRPVHRQARH